jgi:hypothetical protein
MHYKFGIFTELGVKTETTNLTTTHPAKKSTPQVDLAMEMLSGVVE